MDDRQVADGSTGWAEFLNTEGAVLVIVCADCGSEMKLKTGKYGKFYSCSRWPKCRGGIGAHANGKPMGHAGDKETRALRKKAHNQFDQLWEGGRMTRVQAYRWMMKEMRLPRSSAHIALFTKKDCELLLEKLKLARRRGMFRKKKEGVTCGTD